jgi:hypothetical protein
MGGAIDRQACTHACMKPYLSRNARNHNAPLNMRIALNSVR